MKNWNGWPLERLLYLFLGIAFTVVWAQIYLFHGVMADFEESPMYGPIVYTPLMVIAAFWLTATRTDFVRRLFLVLFTGGVIVGGFGVYFHLHGVQEEFGGLSLDALASGPPVLLPAIYLAVSLLGVLIALWPLKLSLPQPMSEEPRPGRFPAAHIR